ncbi:hypothetical protein SAMN06265370_11716 [Puniceibacterium sediminis]|uniref:Uncharacterized protein n=2 Tax=Puniceibacterium sediminis TaxID=1608407 RepID=A0A238YIC8_9RHOB|nr:hypothetical protein SAMN06265370_11716 [Puniceibacterium sediminis]
MRVGRHEPPILESADKQVRVIVDGAYGERAPEKASEMLYANAMREAGSVLPRLHDHEERAVSMWSWVLGGLDAERHEASLMMVFCFRGRISLTTAERGARIMLPGGEALEGPRYIWCIL